MKTYDFTNLNDKDFERLSTDLLSLELGFRFERFRPGRDLGVDGRFFADDKREVILQCKHWAKSSVSALISAIKKTEYAKVERLKPHRYILVTSLELSRVNKADIANALNPHLQSESDVFGNEDINDLLARHPSVERNHYKLWMASTAILDQILHTAILGRSDFALMEMRQKSQLYVPTSNELEALKVLEQHGVVLITGEPGIGKTTLAHQLCLLHLLDGYQLCVIAESVDEAEGIFRPSQKQIFYFDDFLGRNYLSALGRHEDSHIVSFMRRVSKDKTKRLILTSRSTILNQGKGLSDQFSIENIRKNELEIRVGSMRMVERAQVLYNHIWFSDLQREHVDQILFLRRYRKVIEHRNFNPRLIAFVTDAARIEEVEARHYWQYIERTLDNPLELWDHTYESQLDDYGRSLLQLAVYYGGAIPENILRDAYATLVTQKRAGIFKGKSDYDQNAKALVGSLLNRAVDGKSGTVAYSLFNPSVGDYVIRRTSQQPEVLETIFISFRSVRAVFKLSELIANKSVDPKTAAPAIAAMAEQHLANEYCDLAYKAALSELVVTHAQDNENAIRRIADFLVSLETLPLEFPRWADLATAIKYCFSEGLVTIETVNVVVSFVQSATNLDEEDLSSLADLLRTLPGPFAEDFATILKPIICRSWHEWIQDAIEESYSIESYCSHRAVLAFAHDRVTDLLSDYGISFTDNDIDYVLSGCDAWGIAEKNQERIQDERRDEESYRGRYSFVPQSGMILEGNDEIDDLFSVDLPPGNRSR